MATSTLIKEVIDTIAATAKNYVELDFYTGTLEEVTTEVHAGAGALAVAASFNLNTELFQDSTVAWSYDSREDAHNFILALQEQFPAYTSNETHEFKLEDALASVTVWLIAI